MKIGIIGCLGRMGQELVKEVISNEQTTLAGGVEREGKQEIGKDIGDLVVHDKAGVKVTTDLEALIKASDAIIEFTTPATTMLCAEFAAKHQTVLVSGTTALEEEQKAALAEFATKTPIVWAPNMSIGVNLLRALVKQAAQILDVSYDIEVVEMHHRHKVDAPSGTAIALGESAAEGREVALDEVATKSRDGVIGARPSGEIGFATLRGGDVIGDHTVVFAGDGERIELTHKASGRSIYAKGAVRACLWAQGHTPGLYSMDDVLKG